MHSEITMGIYKTGIVGLGRMGNLFDRDPLIKNKPASHAGCYQACDRTELVAGCDLLSERVNDFKTDRNVTGLYNDYKEMLDKEELDILSICTHNDSHKDICVYAANSGVKAIFCEKPMALSIKECEDMIKSCKDNNVMLLIDHTRRFDHSFNYVKQLIDQGRIGEIHKVDSYATVGLLNGGSHLFDLLRYYFGDAEWVSGKIIPDESSDPGGCGIVGFKNGVHVTLDSRWRDYCYFKLDIMGSKGVIKAGGMIRSDKQVQLFHAQRSQSESGIFELTEEHDLVSLQVKSPYLNAVEYLVSCLDRNQRPISSGYDGKASLELAMAFYESDRLGGYHKVLLPLKNIEKKVLARQTSFTKDGNILR